MHRIMRKFYTNLMLAGVYSMKASQSIHETNILFAWNNYFNSGIVRGLQSKAKLPNVKQVFRLC
ncbi:MAG: hypothetical protein QOD03_1094 [Verrucomicrobiota bacterium]